VSLRSKLDILRRESVLLTVAIGFMVVQGVRFAVPAVLPAIRSTFGVSNTAAGLALTLIWLAFALV
jgi:predicted MFS family arabinose efflux permease